MKKRFYYVNGIAIAMYLTGLCSCKSSSQITHVSHDAVQTVSTVRDTLIIRDSIIIKHETRNDSVFIFQREVHDSRNISSRTDSSYLCSADTLKVEDKKLEPKARSTLCTSSVKGIGTRIKEFLMIAGVILICLVVWRIKRL